jgi:Ca2+-binding RTX toxin-like protein
MLDGGPGSDRMGGGDGDDTVSYARAPIGIRANLEQRSAVGWGADVLLDLEHLIGSPRNDRLLGTEGPNRIDGGAGRDRISGNAGSDTLIGGKGRDFFRPGPGDDVVLGGAGSDTFTLRAAPRKVRIDLRRGVAVGQGKDRVRSIEKAVGSRFDDVIRGSKADNHRLVGARGDDLIMGLAGDDRLRGGPGDDILRGGPGDDELDGGPGDDVLIGGPGTDILRGSPGNDTRRG